MSSDLGDSFAAYFNTANMHRFFTFFLIVLIPFFAFSQQTGDSPMGSLSGTIVDSASRQPLQKATVSLYVGNDTKPAAEALSGGDGSYRFLFLKPAIYSIKIVFVGFRSYIKNNLTITNAPVVQNVYLSSSAKALQSITVTGTRSLIQNKVDRIVYNVDKDVTSQGAMATDVLRKIPQVTVDVNGNVELLGNPSIRFLVNGKPSTLFGNSIADALQSIPAAQIQSIEIMSSPGAKYDATGTGGVINIILKKNKAQGFNGTVNATAGTRLENGSVNLSWKQRSVGLNGYFNGSSQLKSLTLNTLDRNSFDLVTGNQFHLMQNGTSDFTRSSFRSGVGMDWELTPRDNLTLSLAYDQFGNDNNGSTAQSLSSFTKTGTLLSQEASLRKSENRFRNSNVAISLDYKKKFRKEGQELSLSYSYETEQNNTSYLQRQLYLNTDSIFSGSRSANPGRDKLSTITLDYSHPLATNFLLETGLKSEIESLRSNADVFTFDPLLYGERLDAAQTYQSLFKRQVYAAYASATFSLFDYLTVIAGLRWEHTVNNASYSNYKNAKVPDYNNLAPSLIVAHNFPADQTLKFSYSYRLERPEYRDLNPFVNLADPHNIITGNPLIQPEIGKNYQLGYNKSFGGQNAISATLVYTHNSPDIKSYTTFYPSYKVGDSVYSNVNLTQRGNIASENRWGANLSGSYAIGSKLTLRPNVQLYSRQTNNPFVVPSVVSGFEYRVNANITYQISHDWVAEAFGNYNSGLRWQGRQAAFSSYTAAVRKQLFNGKASVGLTAVNAFSKYLTQKTTLTSDNFTSTSVRNIPYRSIGINFIYKFGNIKFIKPKAEEDYLNKPPGEN